MRAQGVEEGGPSVVDSSRLPGKSGSAKCLADTVQNVFVHLARLKQWVLHAGRAAQAGVRPHQEITQVDHLCNRSQLLSATDIPTPHTILVVDHLPLAEIVDEAPETSL